MNKQQPLRDSRARPLPQALSAVCMLAIVFLGLPFFGFRQLGSPLHWRVPNMQAAKDVFSGNGLSDSAVLGVCAAIALLVWAVAMVSLCAEVVGALRGQSLRKVRILGPMQRWIVSLIASAASLFTSVSPLGAAPAGPSFSAMVNAPVSANAVLADANGTLSVQATVSTNPVHVVEAGESLWLIAERYFGTGFEWERLANFNDGRDQPAGAHFSAAAGHLSPGWTLEIPLEPEASAANGGPSVPVTSAPSAWEDEVVVQPGDTLWGIADDQFGDGARWPEIFERNRGVEQPDHQRLLDPNLIQPGWSLEMPAENATGTANVAPASVAPVPVPTVPVPVPVPEPTVPLAPTPSVPVSVSDPAVPLAESVKDAAASSEESLATEFRWGLLGGAAALALVRMRRKRRDRMIGSGLPLQLPTQNERDRYHGLERNTIPNADEYRRALDHHLTCAGPASADVVRWDGDTLTSSTAWSSSLVSDDGVGQEYSEWHWSAEDAGETEPVALQRAVFHPSFVSVGYESAGVVALNVERLQVLNLDGDPERVRALAANMMLELDGGGVDPTNEVIVIGDRLLQLAESLGLAGRVRCFVTAEDVAPYLAATRHSVAKCFSDATHEPVNASATPNMIRPVIVVCEAVDGATQAMLEAANAHAGCRGVGIIALHAPNADEQVTIEVRGASTVIGHMGLILESLELDDLIENTQVLHSLEDVGDTIDLTVATFPLELPGGSVVGMPAPEPAEAGQLYVRLLGTPEVDGAERPLRTRHIECIAYLALHGPVDSDRVRTALWPTRAVSESRWSSFLSEIRSALGVGADGELVFPHLRSAGVRLNAPVTTDLDEFTRVYAEVRDSDAAASERALALAGILNLVGGQPFQSRGGYEWAFSEGTVAYAERVIGEACHLAVELAIEAGELGLASQAIERGLNALPGSELLYRDRMVVAHARGDRSEIDRTFRELIDVLEAEGVDATPHPHTVALRDELMTSQMQEA